MVLYFILPGTVASVNYTSRYYYLKNIILFILMKHIIKKFNDISINLLEQTASLTGNSYMTKFKLIIKVNCTMPIDTFIQHILPHREKIVTKNEEFFIMKSKETAYFHEIIGLTEIYYKLDNDSRKNIWDIMLALLYLAEERHYLKNNKNIEINN